MKKVVEKTRDHQGCAAAIVGLCTLLGAVLGAMIVTQSSQQAQGSIIDGPTHRSRCEVPAAVARDYPLCGRRVFEKTDGDCTTGLRQYFQDAKPEEGWRLLCAILELKSEE